MFKKIFSLIIVCTISLLFSSCSESEVASSNVSQAAHNFEVFRRVVFYNGITDTYILTIEAYCSVIPETDGRLSVIIKTDNGTYLKHYLGLSDNVTYFCEQLEPSKVSTKHYRVFFRPSVIVPGIELK